MGCPIVFLVKENHGLQKGITEVFWTRGVHGHPSLPQKSAHVG